jgi:hypothetical protein
MGSSRQVLVKAFEKSVLSDILLDMKKQNPGEDHERTISVYRGGSLCASGARPPGVDLRGPGSRAGGNSIGG